MTIGTEFSAGVVYNKVLPGWEYVIKKRDGTAVKGWAPTRSRAKEKAEAALERGV